MGNEKLRELYTNIELRNRLLSSDFNESSAAACRLVLHYNKVEEKPDRRDMPLLKKLLMKRAKQKNWEIPRYIATPSDLFRNGSNQQTNQEMAGTDGLDERDENQSLTRRAAGHTQLKAIPLILSCYIYNISPHIKKLHYKKRNGRFWNVLKKKHCL